MMCINLLALKQCSLYTVSGLSCPDNERGKYDISGLIKGKDAVKLVLHVFSAVSKHGRSPMVPLHLIH